MFIEKTLEDKIYPSVYIDGLPVAHKTKDQLKEELERKINLTKVKIKILHGDELFSELSGKELNLRLNVNDPIEQAYIIGRTPHLPSRIYQKIATFLHLEEYDFFTRVDYDQEAIAEVIHRAQEIYNKPVKNALFQFKDGRVEQFSKQENGRQVDIKKFKLDLNNAIQSLKRQQKNQNISFNLIVLKPDIDLRATNNLGITELIGEGLSDYTHSSPERIHNLSLAAKRLNGIVISPGKEFSFNKAIGEISILTGYLPGYIIKEGKTVLGDGGGVCQTSTTLFRAVMDAGLPIIEHHHHAYRVQYYENDAPPGLDATIYPPYVDFKFQNNTAAHLLIQTEIDEENNLMTFKIYGKEDDRTVEITPVNLTNQRPPPDAQYHDDPTLKKGIIKQVEVARGGVDASFDYRVHLNNKVMFEKKFIAHYQPWRSVFLVGQAD